MSADLEFFKRTEWKSRIYVAGKCLAAVEVAHWSFRSEGSALIDKYDRPVTGANVWNVYAWIYPSHPLFAKYAAHTAGDKDSYALTKDMPLHGGQTFFQRHHAADGTVTAVQVGCDYMHYGDEHFNNYTTREEADEVFADATRLHAWLTEQATGGAA